MMTSGFIVCPDCSPDGTDTEADGATSSGDAAAGGTSVLSIDAAIKGLEADTGRHWRCSVRLERVATEFHEVGAAVQRFYLLSKPE